MPKACSGARGWRRQSSYDDYRLTIAAHANAVAIGSVLETCSATTTECESPPAPVPTCSLARSLRCLRLHHVTTQCESLFSSTWPSFSIFNII